MLTRGLLNRPEGDAVELLVTEGVATDVRVWVTLERERFKPVCM